MKAVRIVRHPLMSLLFVAVPSAFSSSADAQARTTSADASVRILPAASAEQVTPLDFGRVLPSGQGGILTMAPDGAIQCTGGLRCDSRGTPGLFKLSGADDLITVSVSPSVTLAGPGGESIALQPLLSLSEIRLNGGTGALQVGGVLTLAAGQAPGRYAGTYIIDLQYQ